MNTTPLPLFAPRARASDPNTSHVAADSLNRRRGRVLQWRVWELLDTPASDVALVQRWRARWPTDPTPDSSIRTRRHELTVAGFVVDAGTVTLRSGRRGHLWQRSPTTPRSTA